jgi:hypothetical protein
LAGKASDDMIRKVEKSLRKVSIWGRRRKKGAAKKSSAAARVMNPLWVIRFVDFLYIVVLQMS